MIWNILLLRKKSAKKEVLNRMGGKDTGSWLLKYWNKLNVKWKYGGKHAWRITLSCVYLNHSSHAHITYSSCPIYFSFKVNTPHGQSMLYYTCFFVKYYYSTLIKSIEYQIDKILWKILNKHGDLKSVEIGHRDKIWQWRPLIC